MTDKGRGARLADIRERRQKVSLITVLDLEHSPHREIIDQVWLTDLPWLLDLVAAQAEEIAQLRTEVQAAEENYPVWRQRVETLQADLALRTRERDEARQQCSSKEAVRQLVEADLAALQQAIRQLVAEINGLEPAGNGLLGDAVVSRSRVLKLVAALVAPRVPSDQGEPEAAVQED